MGHATQPLNGNAMIRKTVISFIFLLQMTNCGKKEPQINDQNKMIVYSYYMNLQDNIDTIDVLTGNRDSIYFYKRKNTTETEWLYELNIELKDPVKVDNLNYSGETLQMIDRKEVKLYFYNNRYYFVYKILHYSYAIDSEGLIFWSPEFGIILTRSLTWPSFDRFEYLKDDLKNQIIRHLAFAIISDQQFYNEPDWVDKYKTKHNP
jgi:hypothetical protein